MSHSMGLHAQAAAPSFFTNATSPSSPADARKGRPGSASGPAGVSRSSVPDSPFEGFPVPSIPPRLRDIGRQLSASAREFLDDPGALSPSSDGRPAGFGQQPKRRTSESQGKSPMGSEVPGMGDEPVLCPFCDKPLPPALFERHSHPPKPKVAPTPLLTRSQTINGAMPPNRFAALAQTEIAREEASLPPKAITPQAQQEPPVSKADADPKVNSESLGPVLARADNTNHTAAELEISEDELKRWSKVAGIAAPALPEESVTTSTAAAEDKPFPLLAPPPPPVASVAKAISSRPSSRFGFFGRQPKLDEEDESDDDGGVASGYAKLDGGADIDDDDETEGNRLHDEPEELEHVKHIQVDSAPQPPAKEAEVVPAASTPATPADGEVRLVLQEVLGKVNSLTKSHANLLDSQSILLTSLKIARSNLAMAEANSEMLEEQLKRATAAASVRGTRQVPSAAPAPAQSQASRVASGPSAASGSAAAPANQAVSRLSGEQPRSSSAAPLSRISAEEPRTRPTSLQMPVPNLANSGPSTGPASNVHSQAHSWNFPFRTKRADGSSRIPTAAQLMNMPLQLPSSRPGTPTKEQRGFDFASLLPNSPAAAFSAALDIPRPSTPTSLPRSASSVNLTSPPQQSQITASEIAKLRAHLQAAQAQISGMSRELSELKKGKLDMEQELENLSQALFEEANKMVADERRKRAEVEDTLKEIRAEKDALRQTVKVLGGSTGADEDGEGEEDDEGAGGDRKPSAASDDSFRPRDLDKHYEALKRAVHHVGELGPTDSATAAAAAAASTSPEDHPIMPGGMVDLTEDSAGGAPRLALSADDTGGGGVGMSKSVSETGVGGGGAFGRNLALSPVPERSVALPPLSTGPLPVSSEASDPIPPDSPNPWASASGPETHAGFKEVNNGALGKMQEMDAVMAEMQGEMKLDKEEDAELKGKVES